MGVSRYDGEEKPFEHLLGKTIAEIKNDRYAMKFVLDDGTFYIMDHQQDCCESVEIEEIHGDLDDLIGTPITLAEETTKDFEPNRDEYEESGMWTFYKLATIKGYVTIRWYGSSDYYSVSVDFRYYDEDKIHSDKNFGVL